MFKGASATHRKVFERMVNGISQTVNVRQPGAKTAAASSVDKVLGKKEQVVAEAPVGATQEIKAIVSDAAVALADQFAKIPSNIATIGRTEHIDVLLRCKLDDALLEKDSPYGRTIFDNSHSVVYGGAIFSVRATDRTGLPPGGPYILWVAMKKIGTIDQEPNVSAPLISTLHTTGLTNDFNPAIGQGGNLFIDTKSGAHAVFGEGLQAPTWQAGPPMLRFSRANQTRAISPAKFGAVTTIMAIIQSSVMKFIPGYETWLHSNDPVTNGDGQGKGRKLQLYITSDPQWVEYLGWEFLHNDLHMGVQAYGPDPVPNKVQLLTGIDDGTTISFYVDNVLQFSHVKTTAYVEGADLVFGKDALVPMEYADGGLGRVLIYRGTALTVAQTQQNARYLKTIYPSLSI